MPQIRPFTNHDPPAIAEVWRRCSQQPGLALPVSVDLFERLVFSKLYFPESKLFLAFEGTTPLGFAHAAFGPNHTRDWISTRVGVICLLLVCPDCPSPETIARQLVDQCDGFLAASGAITIQGGAAPPISPFYTGLYGGSMPPGILATDKLAQEALLAAGYRVAGHTSICRRSLEGFRPPIDRQMMRIRRSMQLKTLIDPPSRDWWEAMEVGEFDLTRFELVERRSPHPVASLTVRDMGPPSPELPGPAAGIVDLFVQDTYRRQGLATYLLGEAFKQLMQQGIGSVEAHIPAKDPACNALCRKLDLQVSAEAIRFSKDINASE